MKEENCKIGKKYIIEVNVIMCEEWLDESVLLIATYKGEGNFEDEVGEWYNSSVISIKEIEEKVQENE